MPGGAAAKLISAELVKKMKPGSVIADVAIDQGGCCENSRATTHKAPTFIVDGVIHYCVSQYSRRRAEDSLRGTKQCNPTVYKGTCQQGDT